ncbi:MAG TPA: POTRA domain-containing protein, partial [Pyrinomonadaceae bacterium]|nr:POTRA domain-containing protein [Pyrinomonadaceae bacterium]
MRIDKIDIAFADSGENEQLAEQYRLTAKDALGPVYSTPRVRDALDALYLSKKIDLITVAASLNSAGGVDLRFDIKRKTQAQKVSIVIGRTVGDPILEQDLLFKLNLLTPGTAITEQTLRNNADEILDYLRTRGFYQSEVTYSRKPIDNETEVGVTFTVTPNVQATVEDLKINIEGYNKPITTKSFKLRPGGSFSRDRLTADISKVREILRNDKFVAPELNDPRVTYDSDTNAILITLEGKVGPLVTVKVDAGKAKISDSVQTELLPIKREGTLDYSAIVEGERRLENHYQEEGFFFA